jgi:hypothetical protein
VRFDEVLARLDLVEVLAGPDGLCVVVVSTVRALKAMAFPRTTSLSLMCEFIERCLTNREFALARQPTQP